MNKTVSVNLGGLLFNIEEAGYEKLLAYLNKIKLYFRNADGSEEIINDIEGRIAELFLERLSNNKQVITLRDAEDVMEIMGKPEDYITEVEEDDAKTNKIFAEQTEHKLFRDPDGRVLGGVCAGIGHYFGVDRVILRIIFLLFLIFAGSGILLYIILWIVIPEAKTTADKLRMRGEPVNVGNIERRIKDDLKKVGKVIEDAAKDAEQSFKSNKTSDKVSGFVNELIKSIMKFLTILFNIFGKFIGIAFLFFGLILFFVAVVYLFGKGALSQGDAIAVKTFFNTFFAHNWQTSMAFYGIALLIISPAIGLLLSGLRLLLFPKMRLRYPAIVNSFLFVAGLILTISSIVILLSDFSSKAKVIEPIETKFMQYDTLSIQMAQDTKLQLNKQVRLGSYSFYFNDDEQFVFGKMNLNIEKSDSKEFIIKLEKHSRGKDKEQALDFAERIRFSLEQVDNKLIINPYFTLPPDELWRGQQTNITVYVPEGKFLILNKGTRSHIDNIISAEGCGGRSCAGHTLIMETSGLKCLDCDKE
jgi:phage shock protein PspC (stress-responsive transcriptional regulator)